MTDDETKYLDFINKEAKKGGFKIMAENKIINEAAWFALHPTVRQMVLACIKPDVVVKDEGD